MICFTKIIKKINYSKFIDDMKAICAINAAQSCHEFDQIFLNVVVKHAPLKHKLLLRANHSAICLNLCGRKLWEDPALKKFKGEANLKKALSLQETEKLFLTNCTSYFGYLLNDSFEISEITVLKWNSLIKFKYCNGMNCKELKKELN